MNNTTKDGKLDKLSIISVTDTEDEIKVRVTKDYLNQLNKNNLPSATQIQRNLIALINAELEIENTIRPKGNKFRLIKKLESRQIADILLELHTIVKISLSDEFTNSDYDLLAIYQTSGINKGIYSTADADIRKVARTYNKSMKKREFEEICFILQDIVPRVKRNRDQDLIAVNNGIFNYKTKTLEPFRKDYISLSKSKVNYVNSPINPSIYNNKDNTTWDVESWIHELSDDDDVVNLLWEIIGAIIRPNVKWNKSAWFYSEKGNNGKGTLCHLMRNICGINSYASIPIEDFGKEFLLEPLIWSSAIIVDENNVGSYIDKAANLKAVVTNDMIQINRKFKTPIPYRFYGFMVQCLNELPRIKDKSNSFYRRQLFVPFLKSFEGIERKYIKSDYLNRKEVLEYVLHKVLNMNYYELSEPTACINMLNIYKEFNDPIRQFIDDVFPQFVWDLLPFSFLYDLYKAWFKENSPTGSPQGKNTFIKDLLNTLDEYPQWTCGNKRKTYRSNNKITKPEPLIKKYNLKNWMSDPNEKNLNKLCMPELKEFYRGITRI